MIASERSLPSPHQSQTQRCPQSVVSRLGKTKNGTTKQPARPVKIYVLDPKTLQQRLEAYVGQKNKKEAEKEREMEKTNGEGENKIDEQESSVDNKTSHSPCCSTNANDSPLNAPSDSTETLVISTQPTSKPIPPLKPLLPILAPKAQSPPSQNQQELSSVLTLKEDKQQQLQTTLGNGITLQCITSAGFGLPAMPLVVTNGVALLQAPISQSSIQTGGIFLPGITAIPSVMNNGASATMVPQMGVMNKPRATPATKKKAKKRKAKKRKFSAVEKEGDDDDSELAYLRKETTTRLGRVSRPVSQPHSPFPKNNSRVPSPSNGRAKKKVATVEEIELRCETCMEIFSSQEKLNLHLDDCQPDEETNLNESQPLPTKQSQMQLATSTNNQGNMISQTDSSSPIRVSQQEFKTNSETTVSVCITTTTTSITTTVSSILTSTSSVLTNTKPVMSRNHPNGLVSKSKPYKVSVNSINRVNGLTPALRKSPQLASFKTPPSLQPPLLPHTTLADLNLSFQDSSQKSNKARIKNDDENIQANNQSGNHHGLACSKASSMPSPVGTDTKAVSLVPTVDDSRELAFSRDVALSNVNLVPSSFSIPNSPPSQCQSPGIPDNKRGSNSPERECHSPIDPMLLRSRSPFPPPLLETSLNSIVSVSNLSIPEEGGLSREELFMDLGENILESSNLIGRRLPSFDSEPLFASSPIKTIAELEQLIEEVPIVGDCDIEFENPKPLPQIIAPILNTEDANDGEIFQSANYARNFVHPSKVSSSSLTIQSDKSLNNHHEIANHSKVTTTVNGALPNSSVTVTDLPKTPLSNCMESDVSMDNMDSSELAVADQHNNTNMTPSSPKRRSVWQFVKEQINFCGISQACGEISEMADKLSKIARDQFIPIREEEIERVGNSAPIVHVDTPFFSHLLDLPFGTYIFKEDAGRKRKVAPPPPLTSSLSFTGGVEDVEKFLPPNIDLIALPHLTNLDLI